MSILQTWIGDDGIKRSWLTMPKSVNFEIEEIPQSFRLPAPAVVGKGENVLPTQWLERQPKPLYKHGIPLVPNSHYGYNGAIALSARIEFAKNWGYALSFGQEVMPASITRLDDPQSDESIIAALAKQDPKRYPLEVIVDYRMPVSGEVPEEAWVHNAAGQRVNIYGDPVSGPWPNTPQGAIDSGVNIKPTLSPIAPDSVWQLAGKFRADPLQELTNRGIPISIAIDGGERGLHVWQWSQYWQQDPAIVAAKNASGLSWLDYCSERKGHAEEIILNAIKSAAPDLRFTTYFGADDGPLRGAWLTNPPYIGDNSGFWYRDQVRRFIPLPATTVYFNMINTGFTGQQNVLNQVTNATGLMLKQHEPFSYGWLNPENTPAEIPEYLRWIGFLKCWYFLGLVGYCYCVWWFPIGGYYQLPFPEDKPPNWLWFKVSGSYVQAEFSFLQEFIWNSDILPGPKLHAMPTGDPAYEFPTGDSGARVLARKHRYKQEWLIIAWASEGPDRWVSVTLPEIGKIAVYTAVQGTIYKVRRR